VSLTPYRRPTQRAPDWWESARFQAICVAWSFFRFAGESRPAHQRVTRAVDCNNIRYRLKPSEIAKFSRILNDSSLQWV
jgi:hypothetical protein